MSRIRSPRKGIVLQATNTPNNIQIDAHARELFTRELSGYAGISAIKAMTRADCLGYHAQAFRDGKRGARDAARSQMHFEAAQLRNAAAHVLAFHLAVARHGKKGTVAPEEINAEGVRRTTAALCSPRTYRAALALLCRQGWLDKRLIPTGTRTITGYSPDGSPIWRTKRVNKVSLTRAAWLLLAMGPPAEYRPTFELKLSDPDPTASKTHTSPPRPKDPSMEGDNQRTGDVLAIPGSLGCDVDHEGSIVKHTRNSTPRGKVSACADSWTSPASAQSRPLNVEHETHSAPKARTAAKSKRPGIRSGRNATPRTWDSARRSLLTDLFNQLHGDPTVDEMCRVAELQTDRGYPTAFVSVVDWDKWIWHWLELNWHERRRAIARQISPPLAAFVKHLAPPDCEELDDPRTAPDRRAVLVADMAAHERIARWIEVIPAALPDGTPAGIREQLERERWRLNTMSRLVQSGRILLSNLDRKDNVLLKHAADAAAKGETDATWSENP